MSFNTVKFKQRHKKWLFLAKSSCIDTFRVKSTQFVINLIKYVTMCVKWMLLVFTEGP